MPPTRNWAGGGQTAPGAWWQPPPPGHPAAQGHLVPRHQPAPPRRPARGQQPGCGPGRDRADLRDPALDRAKLQTGQGPARLGRLPGPLRHRHPPPPGPGQLRVLLLLGRLVPRPPRAARAWNTADRSRRGERGHTRRPAAGTVLATGITRDTRLASPLDHAAALVAGVVTGPRPHHCKPSSTRSRQATACTSSTRFNKLPLRTSVRLGGQPGVPLLDVTVGKAVPQIPADGDCPSATESTRPSTTPDHPPRKPEAGDH